MTPGKPKLRKRHIDLLLLSIIRAYDHPDRKGEADRLADVREALFGEKRGRGRVMAFDDLALFRIFNETRKREMDGLRSAVMKLDPRRQTPEQIAEIEREPKSVRAAAREFQDLAGSKSSDESIEDRLRRKVRGEMTAQDMAELESLFDTEDSHTRDLITILERLNALGVLSKPIWDENT
ncbi:hypothetical protein EYC08_13860 [Tabrizicola sp. WMC-M-20]|nr:hypothetical protein EYC08_13860 [Tabrizicola sp. WMC-M-20]